MREKPTVLLLHGGPGCTHEYLEACDSYLPSAGVEYYYYDQLGSGFSDQPHEPSLWELDRFVDVSTEAKDCTATGGIQLNPAMADHTVPGSFALGNETSTRLLDVVDNALGWILRIGSQVT